jgi:hypothetical protein
MATLRQYLSSEFVTNNTSLKASDISDSLITGAELYIDSIIGNYIIGVNAPAFSRETIETCTIEGGKITIPNWNAYTDHYSYTVAEVLDGSAIGEYSCQSSIQNSLNHEIIVEDLASSTPYSGLVRFYQIGKFPRNCDVRAINNRYIKNMPEQLRLAIAYQAEFMAKNTKLFNSQMLKSENIGTSYSYTLADSGEKSIKNLTNPKTYAIIESMGLFDTYIG